MPAQTSLVSAASNPGQVLSSPSLSRSTISGDQTGSTPKGHEAGTHLAPSTAPTMLLQEILVQEGPTMDKLTRNW